MAPAIDHPDPQTQQIDQLIAATDDKTQRATLIVLSGINRSLTQNTDATQRIAVAFDKHQSEFTQHKHAVQTHLDKETGMFSGVRMTGWIAAAMGTAIISLLGWMVNQQMQIVGEESVRIRTLAEKQIGVLSRVENLERRASLIEQQFVGVVQEVRDTRELVTRNVKTIDTLKR